MSRVAFRGLAIQAAASAQGAPVIATTPATNQIERGTRAIAVRRCAFQWPTPLCAEPRPRALARGVIKATSFFLRRQGDDEPDDQGHHPREYHHRDAREAGHLRIETVAEVPDQMPDAVVPEL